MHFGHARRLEVTFVHPGEAHAPVALLLLLIDVILNTPGRQNGRFRHSTANKRRAERSGAESGERRAESGAERSGAEICMVPYHNM